MPTSSPCDVASNLTNRVLDSLVDCFGELAVEKFLKYIFQQSHSILNPYLLAKSYNLYDATMYTKL